MAPNDEEASEQAAAAALADSLQHAIRSRLGVESDRYVCFLDGGLPLDPEHMTWLAQSPPFDPLDRRAEDAACFARIADTIPIVGRPWSASTNQIGPMYRAWLDAAVLASTLNPEEQQRLRDAAEVISAGAAAYRAHERAWDSANAALREALQVRGAGTTQLRRVLELKRAVAAALQAWQVRGGKARVEAAQAIHEQLAAREPDRIMASLRARYDRTLDANRTRSGGYTPVDLVPRELFGDSLAWISLSLRPGDPCATDSALHGGGREMPLLWVREPGRPPSRARALDPSRLSMRCELARVQIDRSAWFDGAALTQRRWWWRAAGALFSDGAPPPDTRGEWQMIPTDLVLARALVVTTGEPATDAAALARSAASAGCWIFSLQHAVATSLARRREIAVVDGAHLAAPQVQIAAVVCQLMPSKPDREPITAAE